MPAERTEGADTRSLTILAFSATAGVLVEFYDFAIHGYAATSAFPAIFFPKLPPTQALVFAYIAFGAGFPARLVGAFIFGHFGDRTGRKFSFLLNIAIVGMTTCLTGLLPGYATLGIAAPVLLVGYVQRIPFKSRSKIGKELGLCWRFRPSTCALTLLSWK